MWDEVPISSNFKDILTEKLKFYKPTAVQKRCIPEFLSNKDVIVQSPTGSGKTLSYVLPVLEILLKAKPSWQPKEVGAIVLVPNRELANQVRGVFDCFIPSALLRLALFVGGKKMKKDVKTFQTHGGNIIIATPGRLAALFDRNSAKYNFKPCLRNVEVFIMDEADRLLDLGFSTSLSLIMSELPKVRRTGLYSATIPEEMEELIRTGLRNPVRILISGATEESESEGAPKSDAHRVPSGLTMFYSVVPTEGKLVALLDFLRENLHKKVLVFFSTCHCVNYFGAAVKSVLEEWTTVLLLHGKKQYKRQRLFEQFQALRTGVLVTTDVLTRGVDIADIDWVVHFDPPKKVSWFLHRSGRTARLGKLGSTLLFLMPNEEGYADFLMVNQGLKLQSYDVHCSPEACVNLREQLRSRTASSREEYELSVKAFLGYVQAYTLRDCRVVCALRDVDFANLAYCFGLLRLPVMPELRGRNLTAFEPSPVDVSTIPYQNKKLEAERQLQLSQMKPRTGKVKRVKKKADNRNRKRSRHVFDRQDFEELENDYRLLKKLKKRKISKEEFDEQFV